MRAHAHISTASSSNESVLFTGNIVCTSQLCTERTITSCLIVYLHGKLANLIGWQFVQETPGSFQVQVIDQGLRALPPIDLPPNQLNCLRCDHDRLIHTQFILQYDDWCVG